MNIMGSSFKERPNIVLPTTGKGKDGDVLFLEDITNMIDVAQKSFCAQVEAAPKDQKKKAAGISVQIF
jgi:hypothetical protein